MLNLFFEKNQNWKIILSNKEAYLQVSNNLDSQYYALERVKDGDQKFLQDHYFLEPHPQIVNYYTSWQEKEIIQEEAAIVVKKPKEKKGIMGGLLSKKSKTEHKVAIPKEIKEEVTVKTTVEDVMYVQLESFLKANVPNALEDVKEFMALIYLLALKVFQSFKCWPRMIPVIVESRKFKFIKRGESLNHELVNLFEFIAKEKKQALLSEWSEPTLHRLSQAEGEQKKQQILGEFLKREIQAILEREYVLKMRKGQQTIMQTVIILNPFTLVLKEETAYLKIEEYEVTYYHKTESIRQIIMQHCMQNPVVLQGDRGHLVIRYLKQFMMG